MERLRFKQNNKNLFEYDLLFKNCLKLHHVETKKMMQYYISKTSDIKYNVCLTCISHFSLDSGELQLKKNLRLVFLFDKSDSYEFSI